MSDTAPRRDDAASGTDAFRAARDLLLDALPGGRGRPDAADFSWPDVGDRFNWALDWFDVIAEGDETIALQVVEDDGTERRLTFDELRRRSNRVGNWLADAVGVRPGDTVMLMLGNRVELWEVMLAVLKIGAVVLPTSVVLGPDELADRVERGRVAFVVADDADAAKFAEVPGDFALVTVGAPRGAEVASGAPTGRHADPASVEATGTLDAEAASPHGHGRHGQAPRARFALRDADAASDTSIRPTVGSDDPALVYFTSGTTSKPKIVVHTHRSYPVGHLTTMRWIGVRPGDVHMVVSSPGWGKHAWSSFFAPWHAGATIFVLDSARFDAKRLVAELDRAEVTTFCAPPTVWRMLIQARVTERPGRLREIVSAGEPLNPEVIARIRDWWGLEIRDGYGQTETTAIIGCPPGEPVVPGSMGRPLPGVGIVLLDPATGEPLAPDAVGEGEIAIDVRGSRPVNLMQGYLGDEAATERRFEGGFFHTGDVASRDGNGVYTFVGRTDDIFKSSDFKVSPFEVESRLLEHDAVAEAAVVGAPDATRLNITKAYVALGAGVPPDAETALSILRHARAVLPPYMRVRRVEFFELPKTISGKIRRVELRQREVAFFERGERVPTEHREEDFPALKA